MTTKKYSGPHMRWDQLIARLPADRPLMGVEVGVWRGEMSKRVLAAMPNVTLCLVDRWEAPQPGDSFYDGGTRLGRKPAEAFHKAHLVAAEVLEPYRVRCRWLVGHSVLMAERVPDDVLDFVFIDGDHSYAGCLADIEAWAPKVKAGGLIGGHDYGDTEQGDVEGAVKHYFSKYSVEVGPDHCWWVRFT